MDLTTSSQKQHNAAPSAKFTPDVNGVRNFFNNWTFNYRILYPHRIKFPMKNKSCQYWAIPRTDIDHQMAKTEQPRKFVSAVVWLTEKFGQKWVVGLRTVEMFGSLDTGAAPHLSILQASFLSLECLSQMKLCISHYSVRKDITPKCTEDFCYHVAETVGFFILKYRKDDFAGNWYLPQWGTEDNPGRSRSCSSRVCEDLEVHHAGWRSGSHHPNTFLHLLSILYAKA